MMFNWARGFSRFLQKSKAPIRNARQPRRGSFTPRVEMLEDRLVPAPFVVTSNGDNSGAGVFTLREGIIEANAGGSNVINFNISGAGVHTISITAGTPLPTIIVPVTINGLTQPSTTTTPLIQLQGPSGNDFDGLRLGAGSGGSIIEGLVVNGFGVAGIELDSNGNKVQGNFIGTSPAGTSSSATLTNFDGVLIADATGNTIGGIGASIGGTGVSAGNLISGNGVGIVIAADGGSGGVGNGVSSGNLVQGNFIGSDVTGANILGNTNEGILIQGGTSPSTVTGVTDGNTNNNTIGGAITLGNALTLGGQAGNLISGNGRQGVTIFQATAGSSASGNLLQGDYIGPNAAGNNLLSSGTTGNTGDGVRIDSAAGNTIGGTAAGVGNVISGNGTFANGFNGINILNVSGGFLGANNNLVAGNRIGTDATGLLGGLANKNAGVQVAVGAANNTIGLPGAGNLISGNGYAGVQLFSAGTGNIIQGNEIGTNLNGGGGSLPALFANAAGVIVFNTANSTIGGGNTVAGNLISNNATNGIDLFGATGCLVESNAIGTIAGGSAALANANAGVLIQDENGFASLNNTIGAAGAGNLISGNTNFGVAIVNALSTGNLIQGNAIGTNAAGASAVPNGNSGILFQNTGANTIGSATGGAAGNLISGNSQDGIVFFTATGALVEGNNIGANKTLGAKLANGQQGILLTNGSINNTIGGPVTAGPSSPAANFISGNGGNGVFLGAATSNLVIGNVIGGSVYSGASVNLGNTGSAVALGANSNFNTVGGNAAGANRIINNGNTITGTSASNNTVGNTFS
jgi:parallel beta-helix repeat protein